MTHRGVRVVSGLVGTYFSERKTKFILEKTAVMNEILIAEMSYFLMRIFKNVNKKFFFFF